MKLKEFNSAKFVSDRVALLKQLALANHLKRRKGKKNKKDADTNKYEAKSKTDSFTSYWNNTFAQQNWD